MECYRETANITRRILQLTKTLYKYIERIKTLQRLVEQNKPISIEIRGIVYTKKEDIIIQVGIIFNEDIRKEYVNLINDTKKSCQIGSLIEAKCVDFNSIMDIMEKHFNFTKSGFENTDIQQVWIGMLRLFRGLEILIDVISGLEHYNREEIADWRRACPIDKEKIREEERFKKK